MALIKRIWNGELRLAEVFWGSKIAGLLLLLLLKALTGVGAVLTWYVVYLAYFVITSVGIWRSANCYTGNSLWRILAKVVVILNVLGEFAGFLPRA